MSKNKTVCITCKNSTCVCGSQKPKTPPETLGEAIKEMIKELPEQIAYYQLKAQYVRAYYQELVKQGFTENEALELCKHFNF